MQYYIIEYLAIIDNAIELNHKLAFQFTDNSAYNSAETIASLKGCYEAKFPGSAVHIELQAEFSVKARVCFDPSYIFFKEVSIQ